MASYQQDNLDALYAGMKADPRLSVVEAQGMLACSRSLSLASTRRSLSGTKIGC